MVPLRVRDWSVKVRRTSHGREGAYSERFLNLSLRLFKEFPPNLSVISATNCFLLI